MAAAQILHQGVAGDHHLRGPISLMSPHRSQPAFELTVIGFYRIIRVLLDVMPRRRQQLIDHGGIDRRGVSDHLVRNDLQHLQRRPGEEPTSSRGVPSGRQQHVDELAVLVDAR